MCEIIIKALPERHASVIEQFIALVKLHKTLWTKPNNEGRHTN